MKLLVVTFAMLSVFTSINSWESNNYGYNKRDKHRNVGFFGYGGNKSFPGQHGSTYLVGKPDCPYLENPVCATNGKTYSNKCKMKKAGGYFAYKGWCKYSNEPYGPQNADADPFARTPMNGYLPPGYPYEGCRCNKRK